MSAQAAALGEQLWDTHQAISSSSSPSHQLGAPQQSYPLPPCVPGEQALLYTMPALGSHMGWRAVEPRPPIGKPGILATTLPEDGPFSARYPGSRHLQQRIE